MRAVSLAGAGLLSTGVLVGAAPPTAAEPTANDSGDGKLMLVMDSSGSMAEPAGDGTTRIQAARQALNSAVDSLPNDANVGMRV